MRKIFAVVLSAAWLLASCGGSGTEDAFREGGGLPPGSGGTATATQISIASDATTIPSDGSSAATITAYARDASNVLVPGVAIRFSANSGGITPAQAVTNAAGEATATLNTAGDTTPRTIVVTAASGTLTATANVMVTSGGTGAPTVSIGSGTGAAFQSGIIGIANNMLSAGGSTSLTAVLQQSDGTLYQQAANVSFSSPCAASGRATIQSPVTTSTGIASTTYVATGCSGSDVISASATIGGIQLSASGSVTVATAAIGSIEFVSATPTNVALRGTGAPGRSETSTVVFRVLDSSGGPRADADVDFSLNTTVGGIALNPTTARSDANGRVQTVVQAGDSATTVRVTARVLNTTPAISTQSSQLTITTGVPDDDSLSLAVACPNVEALSYDGVPVTVTARLADRFNNPVPDGTAVTFNTEGGRIGGQCTTATTPTEGGVCAVTWTSSAPRPSNGRVTLIATAIGEETFTDANGNGAFDNGETFIDRAERFRDDNENGVYDSGEYFYDFNTNGIRDPADGLFNGLLCRDTTGRCNSSASTSGIAGANLIIMSGSNPVVTRVNPAAGGTDPITMSVNGSIIVQFYVRDVNDNSMPANTDVALSASGAGLQVGQPSSFKVPCSFSNGPSSSTLYSFSLTAGGTPGSGIATLSVKTAGVQAAGVGSLETIFQIPVTVQ